METRLGTPAENESTIKIVKVIYILNFVSLILPICSLIAVVLAYIFRDDAYSYLKSHFQFLIRSFWIGVLYFTVAGILCLVVVGFVLLALATIWWIVRNARGLKNALQGQEMLNPATWWV